MLKKKYVDKDVTAIHSLNYFTEKLKTWYKASNNFYYKMFLDQVSYATAKANCQEKKANLASVGVRDSSMRNHLISLASGENVWIGLNDIEHEGNFIWEDGVVSTADNTPWINPPDDYEGNEDCVHLTETSLNDYDCSKLLPYICEKFV
ncbi:alpha-N-acetylgalactosamine-specific lectin-like isoform X1 [Styela clava]